MPTSSFACVLAAGLLFAGCQSSEPPAKPMLTPTLTMSRAKVPLGTPVDMTYKFVVAPDAKFAENYHVFVHFADRDGQLMYTDDHDPPTPTSQWKTGETVEYTRTFFAPVYPYVGPTTVEIGMFSPDGKQRVPMAATDTGHRSYQIASFQLVAQNEGVQLIYKDGFHAVEGAAASGTGFHWTKKEAVFAITNNPKRDSLLYLDVDNPSALLNAPQQITVSMNGMTLDQFALPMHEALRRKIKIPAAAWGTAENVDLSISVDKTFVPSQLSDSKDPRELGIRIQHAAVVPLS